MHAYKPNFRLAARVAPQKESKMKFLVKLLSLLLILLAPISVAAQTREEQVRADKEKVEGDGFWIYNDLDEAVKKSVETGKPILVTRFAKSKSMLIKSRALILILLRGPNIR